MGYNGIFARLNYDYEGRYLLEEETFVAMELHASAVEKNQRWGTFPSVSIGWNIAREAFWNPGRSICQPVKTTRFFLR